jgi:hypothetical protein
MPLGFPISRNAAEFVGQVANLPHIRQRARLNQHRCPVAGKISGIAQGADAVFVPAAQNAYRSTSFLVSRSFWKSAFEMV